MKSTGENEPTLQPQRSRRGLWIVIGVIAVVVIIVVSGAMTNWFGLGGPSPIQLNGAGSSFAFPLMTAWSTQYKALTGVQINYQATPSGAWIYAVTAKTTASGGTAEPLGVPPDAQTP